MLKLFALCDLSCSPTFPHSLIGMAWTGSEPELVGTDAESASAWEVVTDNEKPSVKEEEVIDKLADDLSQVVKIDDEPDVSPDDPSQDQPPNNSFEPKEPDVPPPLQKTNLQPPTIHQPLIHQQPLTLPQHQMPLLHLQRQGWPPAFPPSHHWNLWRLPLTKMVLPLHRLSQRVRQQPLSRWH